MAEEKKSDCTKSSTLPNLNKEANRWADLVGVSGEEAEKKIKEEMQGAKVYIIPPNSAVTMDYRTDRVRIFVDQSNKVVDPPTIG